MTPPHRYDRTGERVEELDGDEDLEQQPTEDRPLTRREIHERIKAMKAEWHASQRGF